MNCVRWERRLSDFLDETLSAREMVEAGSHLAECPRCASRLNDLRKTVSALRGAERLSVSNEFGVKLQARLAGVRQAPPRRAWLPGATSPLRARLLPAWGAAAMLAVAFLFVRTGVDRTVAVRPGPEVVEPAVPSAVTQSLVLTAADPFEDLGAANLAALSSFSEGGQER